MTGGKTRRATSLAFVLLLVLSGMGWLVPTSSAGQATVVVERLVDELRNQAANPAPNLGGERWIDVDRANGRVALMEGNTALYVFWGSLGRDQGEGYYATASGTYQVFAKNRALTYTPYAENYITHWVGFDPDRRNGFHSYTKDASGVIVPGGGGYTAGCVSLPPGSIEVLFDFAWVGMRVEVHW